MADRYPEDDARAPGGTGPTLDAGRGGDLGAWARAVCLDLPDARADRPFGPQAEVFRIRRKMFALLMERAPVSARPLLNLKADPQEVPLLLRAYDWILPGYHMNKRHWVSVVLGPDADRELLAELVEDSYDNVVATLPAALQPMGGEVSSSPRLRLDEG